MRRLNRQKAANHQYLEAVIEHVGVALVCLDEQGDVKMANEPARRLFGVPHLNSVARSAVWTSGCRTFCSNSTMANAALFSVQRGDDCLQLVLYATTFELLEQRYKLVSFQNIRDELDQQRNRFLAETHPRADP